MLRQIQEEMETREPERAWEGPIPSRSARSR
jgi:hypothetical protein